MTLIKSLILTAVISFSVFAAEGAGFEGENQESDEPSKPKLHPACKEVTYTAKRHRTWANHHRRAYSIPKKAKKKHAHMLRCAAGPGHKVAMKKHWKKIKRSVLPANHDLWIKIGVCEQPGSGYKGVNWSHTGPTYQGGLGFWYGTWSGFKYPGMPSNAGYATWRQQMKVANRLLAMYGTSPWGCA